MALYNEILTGRHNRFLQKLFAMKGGPPTPQLAAEISVAQPIFHGHENRISEGWRTFGYTLSLAASVGNVNGMRLRNPVGSNAVIVVELLAVSSVAAGAVHSIELSQSIVDLATVDTPVNVLPRDGRISLGGGSRLGGSVAITSHAQPVSNSIGVGELFWQAQTNATETYLSIINTENQEFSVLPGNALNYFSSTNISSAWTVFWRERALEELERTP